MQGQRRGGVPSLSRKAAQYLLAPGGVPKAIGIVVGLGVLASPLFTHPTVREIAGGLGAALMLWWLGFKVRDKAELDD